MDIINEIDSYIDFLKSELKLLVTLHPRGREELISGSSLIKYNIHSSPYCMYLKTNADCHRLCVQQQDRLKERLLCNDPFTGVCHAGVKERVYGLFLHGEYLGFVSVSGYKTDSEKMRAKIRNICSEFCFSEENVLGAYDNLSENIPSEQYLDSLITPLCRMLEYGNLLLQNHTELQNPLFTRLIQYINGSFCSDISLETLAHTFNVSKSHISHTFKKTKGVSISEYVISLRMELAENLLTSTAESVTDIAFITGFSDGCYFSNVFKKTHGKSPAQYRKANKKSVQ